MDGRSPRSTSAIEPVVRSKDSRTAGRPLLAVRTKPVVCDTSGTSVWIAQTMSASVGDERAGATPLSTQALRFL